MRQRNLVDERGALHNVRRGVDVRGVVHAGGDALRQHAGLGVIVDALDLDVLEIGPVRGLVSEAVGQVVELEPHAVVQALLERDAADFLGHAVPPNEPPLSRPTISFARAWGRCAGTEMARSLPTRSRSTTPAAQTPGACSSR